MAAGAQASMTDALTDDGHTLTQHGGVSAYSQAHLALGGCGWTRDGRSPARALPIVLLPTVPQPTLSRRRIGVFECFVHRAMLRGLRLAVSLISFVFFRLSSLPVD